VIKQSAEAQKREEAFKRVLMLMTSTPSIFSVTAISGRRKEAP